MLLSWTAVKQSLEDVGFQALDVFTTGKRDGFQRTVLLLLTCSFSSLLLSALLLLYLLFHLDYETAVAGGIAGCFGTLLTVALFLSKRVRCLGTLFVISIFMKKSRNLLLTAGTSLVVLKNIVNTLENLTGLLRSMICNLKAKKSAIITPFSNYVKMLKWIGSVLKGVTDLGVVNVNPQLKISLKLESEKFREKLSEAEQRLDENVKYAQSLVSTFSTVTNRLFPAISFLVLMTFIALHIKKYCSDMKYENRFISSKFVRFDEKQRKEGKPHILPLTPEEGKLYTAIPSTRPTAREGKVGISAVIGLPFSEEIHHKDFSYSVTLFEKKCLPKPKLLFYNSIFPLAVILVTLVVMALMAAKMSQLRLVVCERFFSSAADGRVEYLHAKILQKRLKGKKNKNTCSLTSLIVKPHFWCPLLFQPKEDPQVIV
ncbi:dendritic cell-specific transmembrane protein [Seriola lalandi dorsalis]|uniref:dendritic cell-specific transmembrane protein n=1 Tax=Seriola lalandi dorsalis TaxID=1841481 RepID=UPI000C6F7EA8|nr:dendritic cell-specific transmembrane protein [Seriola lalandi dorsalis]